MDLALNNLQMSICHKTQQTKPMHNTLHYHFTLVAFVILHGLINRFINQLVIATLFWAAIVALSLFSAPFSPAIDILWCQQYPQISIFAFLVDRNSSIYNLYCI